MHKPTLSISAVIPAYNCEKYVGRAIDSVLNQTVPVQEIIVVDDGSTDRTADIVRAYGTKVILIQQPNAGVSAARNAGIRAAKGDWVAFLDADDEWLPHKIRRQTEIATAHPELMWMTGNYLECLCNENRRAPHSEPQSCIRMLEDKEYYENYLKAFQNYQSGHTDCMLIRRQVFETVGVFPTGFSLAEDLDLWLRIGYRYPKVGFSTQPLAVYHLAVSNSLMITGRTKTVYTEFIERHFKIAQSEGVLEDFIPVAGSIMRRWIRGLMFEGRKHEIRLLLDRFPEAFPLDYRILIKGCTIFPRLTRCILHSLSKIIRTFKLRRRLTRPPQKPTS